jgi:hypothetical protein
MPAQHRPNEVTRDTIHRVFAVPESLRHAVQARRQTLGQTLRLFLVEAVEVELPRIVQALREALPAFAGERRPCRVPLNATLLTALHAAAGETGVSIAAGGAGQGGRAPAPAPEGRPCAGKGRASRTRGSWRRASPR